MNEIEVMLLACVLAWASISDIARRRIPNVVLAAAAALAAAVALAGGEPGDAPRLALGAVVGLVFALPLFALNAIGAGDAKLFAVVGMIAGPALVPAIALFTALAGGVLALVWLIATSHGRRYATHRAGAASDEPHRAQAIASPRLPYAVAIAGGTALALLR